MCQIMCVMCQRPPSRLGVRKLCVGCVQRCSRMRARSTQPSPSSLQLPPLYMMKTCSALCVDECGVNNPTRGHVALLPASNCSATKRQSLCRYRTRRTWHHLQPRQGLCVTTRRSYRPHAVPPPMLPVVPLQLGEPTPSDRSARGGLGRNLHP